MDPERNETTVDIRAMRALSPHDFAALGSDSIAYVKAVTVDDKVGYAIHAADGSPVAVMNDRAVAFAAVRQNGLEPLNVH